MRTFDVEIVVKAVSQYAEALKNFEPEDWLSNLKNIALVDDFGNVALFEDQHGVEGAVTGHYFFFSRGGEALKCGNRFLRKIFSTEDFAVETILGLTPVEHKGALWVSDLRSFQLQSLQLRKSF